MAKTQTLISLDSELKEKAKKMGVNLSAAAEIGIRQKCGELETAEEEKKCYDCPKTDNLMFLQPEGWWICEKCFDERTKRVKSSLFGLK